MYQCTVLIIKYCFAHITLMVVLIKFALSLSIYIYANSPKQVNYMYLETACLIELRSFRQRVVSPTVSSPTSRVDSPTCRFANCQFANANVLIISITLEILQIGNTLGMNFRYIHLKRKHNCLCFCESYFKFITTVFPKIQIIYRIDNLEFPTHYFDFHLLTTSVNAKYYY